MISSRLGSVAFQRHVKKINNNKQKNEKNEKNKNTMRDRKDVNENVSKGKI